MGFSLDALGQFPSTLYVQLCLPYGVKNPSSYPLIVKTIENGLRRLSTAFPWVAGEVVVEGACKGCSGTRKIKLTNKVPLVIKDLRNDPAVPTMDELRRTRFPMDSLDENVVAPCKSTTCSESKSGSMTQTEPVFLVQINFIVGGLLLTFVGHHSAMDMTGETEILRLLSKACGNEPFSSEEIRIGNLDRSNIIPVLNDLFEPETELVHQLIKPSPKTLNSVDVKKTQQSVAHDCSWKCFIFPKSSLVTLKMLASRNRSDSAKFVSTDDSLTAFIFKSIIRARLPRLSPTTRTTLTRCVNVRRYLGIPMNYPGNALHSTYHNIVTDKFVRESHGNIASQLRLALDPSDLAYKTRALATYINRIRDKSVLSYFANLDTSESVMLSSWAKMNCCDLDFNLGLGKPEVVRRPQCMPTEGLVYLLPQDRDGEIPATICLRNEDMERLRADEEFIRYAVYVG
ncbi:trichothecene 3-O-acetyltransferase [Schizosaccharomyces japonicus yFS275]|uniref:Trichothecene 3-O-acetyltransferase n=1 Tax=Schizosaccharomyces japonicus (strain yFS275 / FY16936) TaxID=402676 RepID=B6K2W7_SCHJY|nr:trichothecene 3-O-acetyltransferase [Schizosaccharomyces japonicus yFS275]EEB07824.1 trichothecene 3-O-acetyltransferase [Schizosaccharomyces japonicus yFS275]